MRIVAAELIYVILPMKFTFTTGFGDIKERDALIVKLKSADGVVGYGEAAALAAPIYLEETIQTCMHVIRDFLIPRLLNRRVTIEEFVEDIAFIRGNNIAKHGVETALWQIESVTKKRSLAELIGGVRSKVPTGESIGVQPTMEDLLRVIEKRVSQGYRRIKIKIKPGWDIKPLKKIRRRFPDVPLMVDANSSYRLKDLDLLRRLDEFDLMMIEQPLAYDDIIDHAKVQKKLKTPICLDESILNAEDARRALEIGACRIINVKPGRVGGLIETKKINSLARKYKIDLWCGGMLETGIGKAFNIAAASLSRFVLPADITPSSIFYENDLTRPDIDLNKGMIAVPSVPGLGFEVIEANIKKFTKSKIVLR